MAGFFERSSLCHLEKCVGFGFAIWINLGRLVYRVFFKNSDSDRYGLIRTHVVVDHRRSIQRKPTHNLMSQLAIFSHASSKILTRAVVYDSDLPVTCNALYIDHSVIR